MRDQQANCEVRHMARAFEPAKHLLRRLSTLRPLRRLTALSMIYLLLHSQGVMLFQSLHAETGGATAPEVTKFEPVDTTDLVNLASGDFNYTIPIINIPSPEGGYPLALSYHAGVLQAEEASWVGLGWNLQPGSITRGVRGYPDDFKAEAITTRYTSNEYETFSSSCTLWFVNFGEHYTTYKGWSGYVGVSAQVGYQVGAAHASAGVGIYLTVGGGGEVGLMGTASASVGVGPVNYSLSASTDFKNGINHSEGLGISISLDGYNADGEHDGWSNTFSKPKESASGTKPKPVNPGSASASYSSYSGGGQESRSFGIGFSWGVFGGGANYTVSWIDKKENERAYGYYYHTEPVSLDPTDAANRVNEWTMETDPKAVPGDSKEHALATGLYYLPSNDGYSVMGQGTGGNLRLTRLEDRVFRPRRYTDEWWEASLWPWKAGETIPQARFVFDGDNSEQLNSPNSIGDVHKIATTTSAASAEYLAFNALVKNPETTQLSLADFKDKPSVYIGKSIVPGSRRVQEYKNPVSGKFEAFDIWETDGKHYKYAEPIQNLWSENINANVPKISDDTKRLILRRGWWGMSFLGLWADLGQAGQGEEWFRSASVINTPYAYAWYLSELTYPDYFDIDGNGPSDKDRGNWVKFSYFLGNGFYHWTSSSDGELSEGPINRIQQVGKKKAGMMYSMTHGAKELKYPSVIETATHKAYFAVSPRLDAQEIFAGGTPTQIRFVSVQPSPNSTSLYEVTSQDPSHLGLNLPLPWVAPWVASPTVYTPSNCPDVQNEETTFTYTLTTNLSFTMNGVPFTLNQGQKIIYTRTLYHQMEQNPDAPDGCHTDEQSYYSLTVDVRNQFWNQPVPEVNSPFPDLVSRWDKMKSAGFQLNLSSMMKLDNIYLIEKSTNKLVKQIQFKYDYILATGTPNSFSAKWTDANGVEHTDNPNKGKLTLISVQTFGMGGSSDTQSTLPPYRFEYAGKDVAWGSKYCYDRWGYHKSDGGPWRHRDVNGEDQSVWSLTKITLPSNGTLQIQYEPKDYARVQDRVPLNPRANQGTISNYLVDLDPWSGPDHPWPSDQAGWVDFRARLLTAPLYLFPPLGNSTKGIGPVTSTLNHAANAVSNKIPIQSAPNPKDLKLWMVQKSPAYRGNFEIARVKVGPTADTYLDTPDVMKPLAPQEALTAEATNTFAVERMVNINFEYWTAGLRGQKRMKRPLKVLDPSDMATLGENDRTDSISKSAVVRMISTPDGGVNMMITDPDFEWPIEAPSAMYVTWTANPTTPKLGGGIRVKRILSNDGRRSFSTSYAYTDLVNGDWTTSGVAAQEPPPVGYAADDDRVIQTERGGWANEGGGGIYHSRVVVRHGWSEDKRPAGTKLDDGSRVDSPLGETVFRFISPADLPHRLKKVDYALNSVSTDPTTGMMTNKTNSAAITEIFNMGAWWGQLLWKEDRDQAGHVLGRAENYYTQLEGYLRLFDLNEQGRAGYDPDVEKAWSDSRQNDMSFAWASRGANESNPNLPLLVQKEAQNPLQLGSDFQGAHLGYLNTTVNITTIGVSTNRRQFRRYIPSWKWKDLGDGELLDVDESTGESDLGWHSSVQAVREINLAPIVREIRTYGEGLNLLNLTRNTRWEARTGTVLETETRGRRVSGATGNPWDGHEILVNRNWPAYWFFPGMESLNMLSQKAQTTTSRKTPIGIGYDETFLNSKVSTWFTNGHHWVKGGEFVWNGVSNGAPPMAFPGYASWQPSQISPTNIQPYKSQQWLFAGATTIYDDFSHAIEAVDGDGVYGCSKYGYPYDVIGAGNLPAGILPTAKFANAKNTETLYWNFEGSNGLDGMKVGDIFDSNPNPIARLAKVYTGERAYSLGGPQGSLPVTLPGTASEMEIRFFVKAANAAQAKSVYPSGQATEIISATQAEGGWWFVRAKAVRSAGATRTLSGATSLDDVAVYPWRNQGAPVSISHYAYDRALGLVTSITGSNGRTTRYQYDSLGRLQQVFDVYGKSTSSTRYKHAAN